MLIKFSKLRFKNLMSYGEQFQEIDLNSHNSTLIIGKNGHGKSTILEALTFVLYGKPFRKIKIGQLVNSINQKGTIIEIEFSVNGGNYLVRRGIKPVVFEVYFNGKLLNQDNKNKDYQKILETQILKLSHKSFIQLVVLGSARYEPFMELKPAIRKSIFEELLDIGIFTIMNDEIKSVIANQKGIITGYQQKIRDCEILIRENSEFLKKILNDKSDHIKNIELEISNLKANLAKHEEKLTKLEEYEKKTLKDDLFISTMLGKQNEANSNVISLKNDINKDLRTIKFFETQSTCPTCTQPIVHEFKEQTIHEHNILVERKRALHEDATEQLQKIKDYYEKYMEVVNECKSIKLEISNDLKNTHSMQRSAEKRLREALAHGETDSNEYKKKLEDLENSLKDFSESLNRENTKMKYFEVCLKLTSDTGMKAMIISTYLPTINALINKNLSAMDFYVSFYLDENFDETIKSRYRDTFTYSSFSEGEKSRINNAILFAMIDLAKIKNSVSTNLLFMDEIFDSSLDVEGVDYVSKMLKDVDINIFIISHNDQMRDKFARVLIAEKQGNFSTLNELA